MHNKKILDFIKVSLYWASSESLESSNVIKKDWNNWHDFFYKLAETATADYKPADLKNLFNQDDENDKTAGTTFMDKMQKYKDDKTLLSEIIKGSAALKKVVYKHATEWAEDANYAEAFCGNSARNTERIKAQQKALAFKASGVDDTNWYFHPISFINHLNKVVTPRGILPIKSHYLMTNYPERIFLGQSFKTKLSTHGCYVVTFANIAQSAFKQYGKVIVQKEAYLDAEKMNDDTSLFVTGTGNMAGTAMDDIFGAGNCKRLDKEKTDMEGAKMLAKLQEYATSMNAYMIAGVFDLSSVTDSEVPHHMVGITGLPNADGVFDGTIAGSSKNDDKRLGDGRKIAYSLKNLKEIRGIKVF